MNLVIRHLRSIGKPTEDSFSEEMLAYLVEYPNDKQKALESWLRHPAVKESVERDKWVGAENYMMVLKWLSKQE